MHKQGPSHPLLTFNAALFGILSARVANMNPKPLLFSAVAGAALLGWLTFPSQSSGQADGEAAALDALLIAASAQQTVIAENQAKIDAKLAGISEELRLARIYVGRAGGKVK